MDLNKVFGTDKGLEESGVWVKLDEQSQIKVARMGNPKFKEYARRFKSNAKLANKYKLDDIAEDDVIEIVANTVILDWKGITLNGEELPFSIENAKKVLSEFTDFMNLVVELSNDMETFRKVEIQENKENLGER